MDKETEGEKKPFEEIERLAKEQASKDAKRAGEAEEAKKAKKEAEKQAKKEAEKEAEEAKKAQKEAEKLARERAKKEAEEAKQAKKEAEKQAKEQAKKEAKEGKAKKEPAPEASSDTYQGNFQLVLPPSAGFKQVRQLSESLANMSELKVVWTGGSADEGALIAISVAEPVQLARILSEIPMVEGVEVKGDKINLTLKSSA